MMQFCVMGSGSRGNATLVKSGDTVVMVDAGFSATRLIPKMVQAGVRPSELSGILITHEHTDHIQAVHQLTKKFRIPLYATRHTAMCVQEKAPEAHWVYIEKEQAFQIGDIVITPFPLYHDAVDPVGYRLETAHARLGIVADTGQAPVGVTSHLALLDSLILESNYDPDMLATTPKRPWPLKQRIASAHGHLSNEQACQVLRAVAHKSLKKLVLSHLSRESNTPELALSLMKATLEELGLNTELYCSGQDVQMPWIAVC